MTSIFERFYTTSVRLFTVTEDDYSGMAEKTVLSEIMADVQPYNGGLANKEYGLEIECQKRMFCGNHKDVMEGNHAEVNGEMYRIIYVQAWELGRTAILKHESKYNT